MSLIHHTFQTTVKTARRQRQQLYVYIVFHDLPTGATAIRVYRFSLFSALN